MTGGLVGVRQLKSGSSQRVTFVVIVLLATWAGNEYPTEGYSAGGPALWYQKDFFGVPLQYLLFAAAFGLLAPYVFSKPSVSGTWLLKQARLWHWVALVWLTLVMALILGILRGASEPFVDWRNWVIVSVTAYVTIRWLGAQRWVRTALSDMAIGYGVVSVGYLMWWAAGGGSNLYNVRVPVFYAYNLMLAGFGAFIAADLWFAGLQKFGKAYAWALRVTAVAGSFLIVLSFRRSPWLYLLAGMFVVVVRAIRLHRLGIGRSLKIGLVGALAGLVVLATFGAESLLGRIESMVPSNRNTYANTNQDHFNDLLDAVSVIGDEPIFGLGIGTTYKTERIANWKTKSFDVHNAFLHVWLKFGIIGLVMYIGFHYRLIRSLFQLDRGRFVGLAGCAIYLIAEQVPSLIQTWPYASFQLSIHHGIVIAVLLLAVSSKTLAGTGEATVQTAVVTVRTSRASG